MADTQEAIRRLSIQTTESGTAEATKKLNDLARAQGGVAVASSNTEKATLSLDQKFASIERRYVAQVRAQQDYEKIQRQVNAAVSQNPALQERANTILAAAKDRHDQLAGSQKALNVIAGDLNGRLQAQAGSFGVVGSALSALGTGGLAAAAGIGALGTAFYAASAGAHELAVKARELKDFSEATGLTTNQVQALRSEATKFGVDSDTLQAGLQKFTVGFQDLRLGSGDLLTQIRRINPALAEQMAQATDTATAFGLYGQAVAQTTNIFERNALARAGLGKGGPTVAEFLGRVGDVKALTDAYDAAGKGLQKNMIDKLAELDLQISKTTSKARENFASIFAQPVLEAELAFAKTFLSISETAKNFSISDNLKTLLTFGLRNIPVVGGAVAVASAVSRAMSSPNISGEAGRGGFNRGTGIAANDNTTAGAGGGETPESLAAKWKNYVSVLGTAATPTERLNSAIAELGIKAKESGLGADVLARGIAGLKLDDALARQNAHNAALGAAASVTDLVRAKTLELAKAQQQGVGLTSAQIENAKAVTAAQALGVYQIDAQTDAERVRIQTLFMGTEAATAYAVSQDIINKKLQAGEQLTNENVTAIRASAAAYARVKTQADLYAEAVNTVGSAMSGTLSTGFADMLDGSKSVGQGFQDMSKTILRSIEEMIIKLLIVGPLMRSLQATIGRSGFSLSSLFSGGTSDASALAAGIMPVANGAAFAGGNVVPFARGGIVSQPTLFPMATGAGLMGEAGPEAVMPLRRGSDGRLGVAAGGGRSSAAPQVTVNLIENSSRAGQTEQSSSGNGGFDLTVYVDSITAKNIGNPGSATRQTLGQAGKVARR